MKSSDTQHLYTRDYFLQQVDGFREFTAFRGDIAELFARHRRNLELLGLQPAHRFLDIGCGRGELVIHHASRGGDATGIDYAADAIALARQKAQELGVTCRLLTGSFAELPADRTYDRILASEFIEHLSAEEGQRFFHLARRLLAPGGRLLVFTYPNVLQRRIGYPLERRLLRLATGAQWPLVPPDATSEHYRLYHLNEQTYFSLRRLARRTGFSRVRVFYDQAPSAARTLAGRLFRLVAHHGPLRHCFLKNLTCVVEP
jgi:ubiquinone/menaquinone biosynthesis C-methylase UbiE